MRRLLQLLVPSLLLGGCFGPGEGLDVPADEIYFPVGMAMDPEGEHLFVVSSDFDLQYNGGALQSYRLADLQRLLPQRCTSDQDCDCDESVGLCIVDAETGSPCQQGERSEADQVLYPGRCKPIDQRPLIQSRVKIGAFATDVVLRERPEGSGDPQRLFIPVRGDTTLHWIDVAGGELHCGQANNDGACDDRHRAGDDPAENVRGLELQTEPFAIDANEDGTTLVVSNQTSGTASLFVNEWNDDRGPTLRFALASDRIPSRPVGLAALPLSSQQQRDRAETSGDTFLMAFRNSAQVRLLRFAPDAESSPDRPYLVDGGGVSIDSNATGTDSRGLAVDASARRKAEDRCGGDAECENQAALIPLDVYVANRSPASLLIGRTQPPQEYPYFFQSLPLTIGPSRVVIGHVRTPSGEEETRVFAICFDSRRIFVYDPKRSRIEAEIVTGRGPHAVVVDTARSLLYVGHFTDSYIGVFSLDLSSPATYGTMLGTLGNPKTPRSSK
jgi:hypothetical protein